MIPLADLIHSFKEDLLARYGAQLLPSHYAALGALAACRNQFSHQLRARCEDCDQQIQVPHSCGHRACPHCQHHEGEQWLVRQRQRLVPATYFLVTFTLPRELRPLAWAHQREVYDRMIRSAWETLRTFTGNDEQLQGAAGAIAVLHTHSRRLDYHPHVHVVIPAAAIDTTHRLWRQKRPGKKGQKPFLFPESALAKVFRAKLLDALSTKAGLTLPATYPERWVVDCTAVGEGEQALVYLGRYLYRGVIREQDILSCENGQVTFRYFHAKRKQWETRSESGATFLWLLLQHVLPKRFRRARNFGFLHPNAKHLIALLQYLHNRLIGPLPPRPRPALRCPCCGKPMRIVATRLKPPRTPRTASPPAAAPATVM